MVPFNNFHKRCNLREHTHEVLQLGQGGPDASIVEVEHSVFDPEAINPEWSAKNVVACCRRATPPAISADQ